MKRQIVAAFSAMLFLCACSNSSGTGADSSHALEHFRMAQYGIGSDPADPENRVDRESLEKAEAMLVPVTVVSTDQPASLTTGISVAQISGIFGISESNSHDDVQQWLRWFINRFKPVYLAHVTALYKISCSTDIAHEDSILTTDQRLALIKDIQAQLGGQKSPYLEMDSPWVGPPAPDGESHAPIQLTVDAAAVAKAYNQTIAAIEADRKAHDSKINRSTTSCGSATSPAAATQPPASGQSSVTDNPATGALPVAAAPVNTPTPSADAVRPSFDCNKASTLIEQSICSDNELAALDVRLSQVYGALKDTPEFKATLRKEQADWIRNTRNKCVSVACLRDAYTHRVDDLESAYQYLNKPAEFR